MAQFSYYYTSGCIAITCLHVLFVYFLYPTPIIFRRNFLFTIKDLLKAEKRAFPANTHLNQFAATAMFAISFLIGGANPHKKVWCYDEGTYGTQSNNYICGIQGKQKRKSDTTTNLLVRFLFYIIWIGIDCMVCSNSLYYFLFCCSQHFEGFHYLFLPFFLTYQ